MNPFQPSVAFHMETSHLIFSADQVNGFYMKCSTELKWVNSPPSFFNVNLKIIRNVHSGEIISSKTSIKGFYMLKVSRHLFEYVWKYLWLVIINSKNEEPLIPISLFHSSIHFIEGVVRDHCHFVLLMLKAHSQVWEDFCQSKPF